MLDARCGWHVAYPFPSLFTNFLNNFLHQGPWIFLFIIVSSMGVAGTWHTLQKSCIVFPVTHQAVYKYSYSFTGDLPLPLVPERFVWTVSIPVPVFVWVHTMGQLRFPCYITRLAVARLDSVISIIRISCVLVQTEGHLQSCMPSWRIDLCHGCDGIT